ncbi:MULTISPECIES: hypothetical protein [Vagococcus]|uniref:Uncharacterized protein n=1 Tax=Vagococcus fluvialis bH819 TaxID=1255619 RepID=A0A1X6WQ85_9ENTE|nr:MULTISPECIES: hypothetical protein [Vagococcus]SLM86418.1 hypothetical protein FM121_10025 [Vagococcus fluvialis bH819]
MSDLKEKIKDQLLNYRDILKSTDVVEEVKTNINLGIEGKVYTGNKENTRKWHSRLY